MLDELAVVIQAEDVDPGSVAVTRPLLVAVENDAAKRRNTDRDKRLLQLSQ